MSLACPEVCVGERIIRARKDKAMFDPRVLQNLLDLEERYLVPTNYFECVQQDVQPYMRKIVATWMMQVCEEQRCEEDVFPLSMNYLDRYLSVKPIRRTQLQPLGSACMLLASKVKETSPLTTEKLVIYTDNSVRQGELLNFELYLLMKLKWDLLSVTPVDFVDQLLYRLPLDPDVKTIARKHANAIIHLCCTEHVFSAYTPSMIAAGSVGAAVLGITNVTAESSRRRLLKSLHDITGVETELLRGCLERVEAALDSDLHGSPSHPNKHAEHSGGVQDCGGGVGAGEHVTLNPDHHHAVGMSSDCRQVDNTPTDVDMVF